MDLNSILEIGGIGVLLLKVLPIIIIINAILAGASVTLNKLKDAAILKDSPLFSVLATVLGYLSKIVDFLSANVQHKDSSSEKKE